MAINLATKYSDRLSVAFSRESFLSGKTSSAYNWQGVKGINIYSILTQPLNDYDRTLPGNRYGVPRELEDAIQEMNLRNDKAFAITIDRGNNTEQLAIKQAGRVMQMQIREQLVPVADQWAMKEWAQNSHNVITSAAAPSATTILEQLVAIETAMNDAFVPTSNRYVAISNAMVGYLRLSLPNADTVTDRLLLKNVVGMFGTLKVIGMPTSWLPAKVYGLAWVQESVLFPFKMRETNLHLDPPGISGHLLEGRFIFDAFVLGAKGNGVVVLTAPANKAATPVITVGASTTTITSSTSGATIKYTVDGSDPRHSRSAAVYSAAVPNPAAGKQIKAAAVNFTAADNPIYMSDLATKTV